jgi:MFS family permease
MRSEPMSDRYPSGVGNGFNTAITPLWISELVPAKKRGRNVATAGNLIAFGIVIAYYVNIGLSYTGGALQWRTPIALQGIFIILQVLWTWLLPESPRWLTQRKFQCLVVTASSKLAAGGRHAEALDVLAQLHGKDIPCNNSQVLGQKRAIDETIALESVDGPWRFIEVFRNGPLKIRRRYILVIGIQAMQQLSGINVLVFYAPHTLRTTLNFGYRESLQFGAGIADTYWVFSFIAVFFLDQMGRRRPLIIGAVIQAICFLAVSTISLVSCFIDSLRLAFCSKTSHRLEPRHLCSSFSLMRQPLLWVGWLFRGCTRQNSCPFGIELNLQRLQPRLTGCKFLRMDIICFICSLQQLQLHDRPDHSHQHQ